MKIAVFKYSTTAYRIGANRGSSSFDTEQVEREINEFCKDKDVKDIKVNTVNNSEESLIVYTVIYN